ncbi:isoprenylcysteine carboxylmethyltransferase family protein [Nitrosomonas sp. JL21]|uniref:methyltransferase family protein n=1 Tax=Nitrosomonas sp. JL21 TaxID=153949 RepID=UPI001371231D|nr:isoprenylcysteine carboxylmethyltransferase family protein [Nitrosomonas sp. JL21]MBL8498951.1 isoprenylcysteine carboxylmethyltransferase family protein [Nitrosomonas sp.]MCC7091592.1 isoprenylcysteine carboxylmethyltransferase family protein [Nitrosomonas sp.]MXS79174.1 isoprenylcysteine carboxylmethyltransferase family protein [Nitrosomonas sp. JL21]
MPDLTLKVPPVVVVFLLAWAMWMVASFNAWASLSIPAKEASALVTGLVGIALIVAGAAEFRAARTTVNPLTPELATSMVTKGIYRYSRNPMYLGFLIMLGAWGVFLENAVAIALVPVFVAYMNRFQILPEEKALLAQFGDDYTHYLESTPRWV